MPNRLLKQMDAAQLRAQIEYLNRQCHLWDGATRGLPASFQHAAQKWSKAIHKEIARVQKELAARQAQARAQEM